MKYACLEHTSRFITIVVETLGALGDESDNFGYELGQRIEAVSCEKRANEFLLQRLNVAIQRGNACCV